MTAPLSPVEEVPPSFFASLGQPCCSRWGKSEIERLALAYVQALANAGDTWKKLTREQGHELLTDEQRQYVRNTLTFDNERYVNWFEAVSDQLSDSDGAFEVRGFWYRRPA